MDADRPPNPDRHESAPATLGDLLYADTAETIASETDWVRLVHAVGDGDQAALRALYDRAHRVVFTLIMRITHDRHIAEELTVDVFHDVWRRAGTYDAAGGTVLGWIMNQARSRAIDRVRFDGRRKRVNPYPDDPLEAPEAAADVLDRGVRRDALHRALRVLTPAERAAIETAFFAGMTHAEVAERFGEPLGTIKARIRSGLGKLRNALTETEASR